MKNLIFLSKYLDSQGLFTESKLIEKLAQDSSTSEWQEIIAIVEQPVSDQVLTAVRYLKQGAMGMYQNAEKLNQLSESDLRTLAEITSKYQKNTASQFEKLSKTAQMEFLKQLGTKGLRLMPVIGFAFSFLIALKNFVYGLTTFAKLVKDSSQIGLNWFEVLFPNKLNEKVTQYQNDPEQLKIITQLTKYSKEFSDEGISFLANIIDFVKDIIFVFIDVGSFGWLTIGDVGLSFILMGIEKLIESNVLPEFDLILNRIISIANQHIQDLTSQLDPTFFDSEYKEESSYDLFK